MKNLEDINLEQVYIELCGLMANNKDGVSESQLKHLLLNVLRHQGAMPPGSKHPLDDYVTIVKYSLIDDIIRLYRKMQLIWIYLQTNMYFCMPPDEWDEAWEALCKK